VTGTRPVALRIRGLNIVPRAVADPVQGAVVVKSGRSTDVTMGRVEGKGVYFPFYKTKDRTAIEGFEIVPLDRENLSDLEISANGDSGSVWLPQDSDTVVGLHFGGERDKAPGKEVALACFATRVFKRLRISLPEP
jgi:hypothetical protein